MPNHTVVTTDDIALFAAPGNLPPLAPTYVMASQADEHLLVVDSRGTDCARAAIWWSQTPSLPHARVGCLGHYAAATRAAASVLLQHATARLQRVGCTVAIAPIDGSTFRNYRFVTQRNIEEGIDGHPHPPFFLEPDNPESWPNDLHDAGFTPMAEYVSARTWLTGPDERLDGLVAQAAAKGVHIRPFDPSCFKSELARLYPVIMQSFQSNLLFAPIPQGEFVELYAPMRTLLQPDLVLLAERQGDLVGFLFALPDVAQAQRGEKIDTVIFKTLAVLPEMAGMGIGSLLAAQAHTNAHAMGYRFAIHALMHHDNRSRNISAHYAAPMRRYALFALPL